jgi:cysteinyl-tRNA synthetase
VDAGAVRLLMSQVHYRQRLDLTDEGLASAREGSRRLGELQNRLLAGRAETDAPPFTDAAERLERELAEALDDDLNAPRAVAAMFAFASTANAALDAGQQPGPRALRAWERAEAVLGVTSDVQVLKVEASAGQPGLDSEDGLSETPPGDPTEHAQQAWALRWAVRRREAKTARNYPEADRIRALLRASGWEVRDTRDGSVEVVRSHVQGH